MLSALHLSIDLKCTFWRRIMFRTFCFLPLFTSLALCTCSGAFSSRSQQPIVLFEGNADHYSLQVTLRLLDAISTRAGKTHEVVVHAVDTMTGNPVQEAEVWFHIIYPSKRNLMPRLNQQDDLFFGQLDLREKGTYTFMVHIIRDDETPETTFLYEIR